MYLFAILMEVITSIAEGMSATFICDCIRNVVKKHYNNR